MGVRRTLLNAGKAEHSPDADWRSGEKHDRQALENKDRDQSVQRAPVTKPSGVILDLP